MYPPVILALVKVYLRTLNIKKDKSKACIKVQMCNQTVADVVMCNANKPLPQKPPGFY